MATRPSLLTAAVLGVGLTAACGDDGGGSAADAGDSPDAEPADSTCGVRLAGWPEGISTTGISGVPVLFHDLDGALLLETATDDDGVAARDCPERTSVTIAVTISVDQTWFFTYGGLRAGQHVVIDPLPEPEEPGDPNSTLEFTLSGAEEPTATSYEYHFGPGLGCQGATSSGASESEAIAPSCLGLDASSIDLLVTAYDGSVPVGFDYATDVPVVQDGTTTAALDGWEPPVDTSYQASGIAPGVAEWTLSFEQSRNGSLYWSQSSSPASLDGTEVSIPFPTLPEGFGSPLSHELRIDYADNTNLEIAGAAPAGAAAVDIDVSAAPPRMVATFAFEGQATMTIIPDGDLSSASAVIGRLAWPGSGSPGVWSYIGPPDITTLRFPELPPSLAPKGPVDGFLPGGVYGASNLNGMSYDELIADPRSSLSPGNVELSTLEEGDLMYVITRTEML